MATLAEIRWRFTRLPSTEVPQELQPKALVGRLLSAIKKAQIPRVADLTWRGRLHASCKGPVTPASSHKTSRGLSEP